MNKKIKITLEISPETFLAFRSLVKKVTKNFTEELWLRNLFTEMVINLSSEDSDLINKRSREYWG